jgi:hypothetical protein
MPYPGQLKNELTGPLLNNYQRKFSLNIFLFLTTNILLII